MPGPMEKNMRFGPFGLAGGERDFGESVGLNPETESPLSAYSTIFRPAVLAFEPEESLVDAVTITLNCEQAKP